VEIGELLAQKERDTRWRKQEATPPRMFSWSGMYPPKLVFHASQFFEYWRAFTLPWGSKGGPKTYM
jgi:hypothetical protein